MPTRQLPFPHQITHSPVYALEYNAHDPGRENDTDVHWLTVGWSQWDEDEPAAKIVRFSGQRWSRQSEEIPLSRLVDLTILLAKVYHGGADEVEFAAGVLESQPRAKKIRAKSSKSRELLATALHRDQTLRRRMSNLADILGILRQERQI